MENSSASRDFPEIPTEEIDTWVKNLIFEEEDDMFSSSSDLLNFESFASWCNTPSATDIFFTQDPSRSLQYVPRSPSHSLDEKMIKALTLFMEFSEEGILAQFWTPIKTGDQYMLSTCDQAYLLDSRLSGYREVSRNFTFSAEANQGSSPGLPGRVFISGVSEWTSNVMYYKTDEYLRMKHALDNEVRGSIAIPVLEESGASCCAVLELVTCKEKPNFDLEMDSVCRALQAVNLQTSTSPRRQSLSSNQKQALAEIRDVLRAVCYAHTLPLALVWIPCNSLLCIEEASCYVNDTEIEGFVKACLEHYLQEGQGVVGKAFISNKPCFSSDVKTFDISEYPLVQHARKFGLNAAVATKLKSTFTGDDDYILEFFLPLSMKGSSEQQLLLDSLSGTMQRLCRTLRTVSDEVEANLSKGSFQTTTLMDTDVTSTTSISSDIASSHGTIQQEIRGARRSEKRKSSSEKNVSLNVLQQYFSGSLKDASKSLGVCPTTLKRICRQHGIMRWPSRKINKVNRSLRKIQTELDSVQGVEGGLKFDSVTGEFVSVGQELKSLFSHQADASLEPKSHDSGEVKLEEGVETNQARSLMEPSAWTTSKQSSLNSVSSSMSDSSNSSGAVVVGSSSTSDWNQNKTHNSNDESGSTVLTVKATYRDNTIRFKLDPYVDGCSQLYKEVGKRFKLQDGTFQLKYLDDDEEWVMLVTDSDLHECLEILDGLRKHTVKFLVSDLPVNGIGSSGGSNGYLGTGP